MAAGMHYQYYHGPGLQAESRFPWLLGSLSTCVLAVRLVVMCENDACPMVILSHEFDSSDTPKTAGSQRSPSSVTDGDEQPDWAAAAAADCAGRKK